LKNILNHINLAMRNHMNVVHVSLFVLAGLVVLAGCSASNKTAQPDIQPSQIAVSGAEPTVIDLSDSRLADALREGDIPAESRADLPWLPKRPPLGMEFSETSDLQTVYFEFDKYSLTTKARETLQRNAEWLKQHPGISVQIEGHCDERGTLEYNQVLGENRAVNTKKYLMSLGVGPDRIYTISYGETQPLNAEHTEDTWAKNRRAVFKVGQ